MSNHLKIKSRQTNKKTKVSGEFPDIFLTLNTHQYIEKKIFLDIRIPKTTILWNW